MNEVTTIAEARQFIEDERQQRAAAFWLAMRAVQAQYGCTLTAMPTWMPLANGTFTLACEIQVVTGGAPEEEAVEDG